MYKTIIILVNEKSKTTGETIAHINCPKLLINDILSFGNNYLYEVVRVEMVIYKEQFSHYAATCIVKEYVMPY